tara:strand:- start:2717 stop:2938 length:222 start_codon:yes stop_codon:yes gene_type:complete
MNTWEKEAFDYITKLQKQSLTDLKTIHKLETTIRELRKQIQLKEDEETIQQEVAFGRTMIEEGNPDMEEDNDI